MRVLISNESMEIVVDGFCRYAVMFFQVVQYRLFEACWDSDYIIWLNNSSRRPNEYTLLGYDAISWVLRFFLNSILVLRFLSQEQNPAGFIKEAIAGEEEGYMAISRKVDKIGVPSIVLEFSPDFNLLLFGSIVFLPTPVLVLR